MGINEQSEKRSFLQSLKNTINKKSFISGNKIWFVLIPIVVIAATDQGIFLSLLEQIQKDMGGYFTMCQSDW